MPVNTISAADVSYKNGVRYIAEQPPKQNPRQIKPVRGYGDKGPTGYPCRAHQLQPRLDLVAPGKPVAADCEGCILDGKQGDEMRGCGRVSVTNVDKKVVYDTFVYYPADVPHRPDPQWLNLGVKYKDIKPENGAQPIAEVIKNVQAIFDKSGTVIGHAFRNDMKMLRGVNFDKIHIFDTQLLSEYRGHAKQGEPSLRDLSQIILKRTIQTQGHSSVEDAQATMRLFQVRRNDFEREQGRRALSPPAVTVTPSTSLSHERNSSHLSSNPVSASSVTTPSTSSGQLATADATAEGTSPAASVQAQTTVSPASNLPARTVGPLPGRKVALPNIAAISKGRVFDYQTSRYN